MIKLVERLTRSVPMLFAFSFGMLAIALITSTRLTDSSADPLNCLCAFCALGFIGAIPALLAFSAKSPP